VIFAFLQFYVAQVSRYPRFRTTYRSHFQESSSPILQSKTARPLKKGLIGCPETWVRDCQSTLREIPENQRVHLHRGGSLKSRVLVLPLTLFLNCLFIHLFVLLFLSYIPLFLHISHVFTSLREIAPMPVAARSKAWCLQPFACWNYGFESRRGHGRMSLVSLMCCAGRGL
jgi:hypothetical protein